jgi:hypothetical protein
VKSPKHVVTMLVALTLAVMLSGCSKNSTPTGPDPVTTVPTVPTVTPDPVLDESPPVLPSQIISERNVSTGNQVLNWTPSPSTSVASYQIYQYSPSPNQENAYVLIGETDAATTQYSVPWSRSASYYRLRATSTTGVQSALSTTVQISIDGSLGADPDPTDGISLK